MARTNASNFSARRNRPALIPNGNQSPRPQSTANGNGNQNRNTGTHRPGRAQYVRRRREQRGQVGRPTRRRQHDAAPQGNGRPDGGGGGGGGPGVEIRVGGSRPTHPLGRNDARPARPTAMMSFHSTPTTGPSLSNYNINIEEGGRAGAGSRVRTSVHPNSNPNFNPNTQPLPSPRLPNLPSSTFSTRFGPVNGDRSRRQYNGSDFVPISYRHGGGIHGTVVNTAPSPRGISMVSRPVPVRVDGGMVDVSDHGQGIGGIPTLPTAALSAPTPIPSPSSPIPSLLPPTNTLHPNPQHRGTGRQTSIVDMHMDTPKESSRPQNTYRGKDPIKRLVQNKKLRAILAGRKVPVERARMREMELRMGERRVSK